MTAPLNLRVLRTLDKADRDAPLVVFAKLTTGHEDGSGAFIDGCGLTGGQAIALIAFLGKDRRIADRIDLMVHLEETITDDGSTAWDRLLAIPVSNDESWSDGKRPKNIGWALDDLLMAIRTRQGHAYGKITPGCPVHAVPVEVLFNLPSEPLEGRHE